MMYDSPKPTSVLPFPNQLMTAEELRQSGDDESYILQARLHATQLIAAIQSGKLAPEPRFLQSIRNLNAVLSECGEPLDISFLEGL